MTRIREEEEPYYNIAFLPSLGKIC